MMSVQGNARLTNRLHLGTHPIYSYIFIRQFRWVMNTEITEGPSTQMEATISYNDGWHLHQPIAAIFKFFCQYGLIKLIDTDTTSPHLYICRS